MLRYLYVYEIQSAAVALSVYKNGCVRLFKFKLEYGLIARREGV